LKPGFAKDLLEGWGNDAPHIKPSVAAGANARRHQAAAPDPTFAAVRQNG
jgi:hypothetical protein